MTSSTHFAGFAHRRISGRAQQNEIADPYQSRAKLKEPTICRGCGAIYHRGRWQWASPPQGAQPGLCPACHRIEDGLPAGMLTIRGEIARRLERELVGLARNEEAAEKSEHPLNRIARIEQTHAGLVITTTDIHLPRRIGEAVERSHHGSLSLNFDQDGYFLRAEWRPS